MNWPRTSCSTRPIPASLDYCLDRLSRSHFAFDARRSAMKLAAAAAAAVVVVVVVVVVAAFESGLFVQANANLTC